MIGPIRTSRIYDSDDEKNGSKTLRNLTAKFVEMLSEASWKGEKLSLNDAANRLNVVKRRLYDTTNVLEVMGVIKKHQRNYYSLSDQFMMLQHIQTQEKEIAEYDKAIHYMKQENDRLIQQEQHEDGMLFIQDGDLQALEQEHNCAFIALKPSQDAIVEFTGSHETRFFLPEGHEGDIEIEKILPYNEAELESRVKEPSGDQSQMDSQLLD